MEENEEVVEVEEESETPTYTIDDIYDQLEEIIDLLQR